MRATSALRRAIVGIYERHGPYSTERLITNRLLAVYGGYHVSVGGQFF